MDLPKTPPFAIRARILTPLAAGGTRHEPDGLLVVDEAGRIVSVGAAAATPEAGDSPTKDTASPSAAKSDEAQS